MKKTIKKVKKRVRKITKHKHFYPSLAVFFGILAISIAVGAKISTKTSDAALTIESSSSAISSDSSMKTIDPEPQQEEIRIPTCSYSCGSWSECSSTGKQTRSCSKSPSGCEGGTEPDTSRSCTYIAPAPVSCSYSYSSWSECSSTGKQTRSYTKSPSGCTETSRPITEQSCTYIPPQNNETPVNAPSCSYSYGSWSECSSTGKQTRSYTKSPSGCTETSRPITEQSCTYKSSSSSETTSNNSATSKNTSSTIRQTTTQTSTDINNVEPENNDSYVKPTTFNGETSAEWQKAYFGSTECTNTSLCGGTSDPDNDGISNNDEYRYGTDPKNADTDIDGYIDSEEIINGFNPSLKSLPGERNDKMVFESPKEKGEIKSEIYKVEKIEVIQDNEGKKKTRLAGKGLPNSYVTVYIYSDPIILTVKTDSDGNWSYELDQEINDGEHEVYVAVTDNTGKITEKSQPIAFVKTAEAITVIPPVEASTEKQAISPTNAWSKRDFFFFIAITLGGLALALASIGFVKYNFQKKSETDNIQ